MKRTRYMLVPLCLFVIWNVSLLEAYAFQRPSKSGSIEGVLIDSNKQPVPGFRIDAWGTSSSSTYRSTVSTDQQGHFSFKILNFGTYMLVPYVDSSKSRYYPGGTGAFFQPHPARAEVSKQYPSTSIVVHLQEPNRFFSGQVRDKKTGKPLSASLHMFYSNDRTNYLNFSSYPDGTYRVPIPPNTALSMEVTSRGYKMFSTSLVAHSDEDPVLKIDLEPMPNSSR